MSSEASEGRLMEGCGPVQTGRRDSWVERPSLLEVDPASRAFGNGLNRAFSISECGPAMWPKLEVGEGCGL